MTIYADLTFVNNFLMTLAIIWAVGRLLEWEYCWWRLCLAAFIGTIYTFIALLIQVSLRQGLVYYMIHIGLNIITASLIIRTAFRREKDFKFWKGVLYLYLVSFITVGTTLSIFYINGGTRIESNGWFFIILGLFTLFIIARYGWRLISSYITPGEFYLPVHIVYQGQALNLTGLIDTGHSLKDPLTGVPVVVVSLTDVIRLFPGPVRQQLEHFKGEALDLIKVFINHDLGQRVRLLPFSGLGQEHGILVGFRPDQISFIYHDQEIESSRIIMALSSQVLDEKGVYQVLIHPQVVDFQV